MRVALGWKAHSGWAALVVVGKRGVETLVVDRRRVELAEAAWARQPYHAAERLEREAARGLVERGIAAARRMALREMQGALERERQRENSVAACAVLVGAPMPAWSADEILAVHFRMHKAEGALFKNALAHAAEACGLRLVAIPEKRLTENAQAALGAAAGALERQLAALGKSVGPPWGKDQKQATLAALAAL